MGYDDLSKSVIEKYRIAESENPDIGIRELANSIGEDFLIVWECLGFKDEMDWMEMEDS